MERENTGMVSLQFDISILAVTVALLPVKRSSERRRLLTNDLQFTTE